MGNYRFSGHQTFVFRYGWLVKGVDLIRRNPHGFLEDDAIVQLGVGKNMVDSIKYWCVQTGLLEDDGGSGNMRLTEFAKYIFGKRSGEGVDPYLEDDATIWLLHYNLVATAAESTWSVVFNHLNKPEFTKDGLADFVKRYLTGKASISDQTIERDIDCFVRSYVGPKSKIPEESYDCPLLALSLIQPTSDSNLFRMNIGPKQNLPVELVGYALLKQMHKGSLSVNLYNATYQPCSPGQVFKLPEDTVVDAVSELERRTQGRFSFADTAGINLISFKAKEQPAAYAQILLDRYYGVKA